MKHSTITATLLLGLSVLATTPPSWALPPPNDTQFTWFEDSRRYIETGYGRIAVVEHGRGPVVVYLHGFPLNAWHWRHQLDELADIRRGIAIDLMGLGHTQIRADQDLRFSAQADMVLATMDAMNVDKFDLVGNDSGGGIAQLIVAKAPNRVRSLIISNADTHDNWPPRALNTVHELARRGELDGMLHGYLQNLESARSGLAALVYENPDFVTEEMLRIYIEPLTVSPERRAAVNRFITSQDNAETVRIKPELEQFRHPTLILWGTGDIFFGIEWAYWLRDTIPGVYAVEEFDGGHLFFNEERAPEVNRKLRAHFVKMDIGDDT